ncbi:MAG TPA: glycosyltransferase family 39 protein [Polyangiaceae bacterium]|nr:glycosyltransferase family 39 protein [Polyangiaceae bacterium]
MIFLGLFSGYLAALLSTVRDLGYSRDEGFYFHAARGYGKWFKLLFSDSQQALERSVLDSYWQENHEHPALMKSLFYASQRFFEGVLFEERGTAYRFPTMVLSALAVAITFVWGRRVFGRAGGVVAALAFACMPRVFYHSHLSCFDLPIAALWLFVAYAYQRSLDTRRLGWALGCALLYGLALDTKHNAWFFPAALVAHLLARHVLALRWPLRGWYRLRIPLVLVLMPLLGPLVFYAGWPWIWHDTWPRIQEYVRFHMQHVYYNMEFLGHTYFEPPFPRSYAWLMTLATVPATTLLLAAAGGVAAARRYWSARGESAVPHSDGGPLLWLCCILVGYGPWLLTTTPIFGGTKHWLTAYPFLALFAGHGFAWLRSVLEQHGAALADRYRAFGSRGRALLGFALAVCLLIGPASMTWHSHPWGLSAYTPLVGGAPGGATLGLNRSFWGYTTGAIQQVIDERSGEGARVYVHDTAMDSFKMLQKDGRLRSDLRPWWTVSSSDLAIYHHEQHMSRVEHMIWVDYGTSAPVHVGAFDGVPVVWLYQRPSYRPNRE